ncbi:NADP-dependent oxidoreductase domain-containing protein [Truncatella angustata]|uniref:NADP-dependent oxidoreductase domain-containing protein n=1 Tax=Truncatella angustata TaxID=152316 RepID=A0A9P8ULV3_9PEZI|nr:NADP-dependent oxidoreductase domain-containing protein [Truncatella angustata]KAH6654360.1 NADP-dependent oxidoreductase domain-containing protein [Truncatella angustata]
MASGLPAAFKKSVANSRWEYRRLGNSGLKVSVPIFGCMNFGYPTSLLYSIPEEQDTANRYPKGASEVIVGKALKKYGIPSEKVIIMTKCFWCVGEQYEIRHIFNHEEFEASKDYVNQFHLSRTAIFNQVNASFKRLNTDCIDVLHIHRFDYDTPLEETMKALHDLAESGKVRYIGASSMWACADKLPGIKFISMQNKYNLLYREEEREVNRFCNDTGVWPDPSHGTVESDTIIIKRVQTVAKKHNWNMTHVALAWMD